MPNLDTKTLFEDFHNSKSIINLLHLRIGIYHMTGNMIVSFNLAKTEQLNDSTNSLEESRRVYGALPYMDREHLIMHNIRRIIYDDSYLVWCWSPKNIRQKGWELVIDENILQVMAALYEIFLHSRKPASLIQKVFEEDVEAMGYAVIWLHKHEQKIGEIARINGKIMSGEDIKTPLCHDNSDPFCKHIETYAQTILDKAKSLSRDKFVWKQAEEGTDLNKSSAATAKPPTLEQPNERLFKMERISAAEWYGRYYRAT
jgi:hypothetical protein